MKNRESLLKQKIPAEQKINQDLFILDSLLLEDDQFATRHNVDGEKAIVD